MALAYLTGSVTQGGADAFAQAEIATALTGVSRVAFRIRELLFEIPRISLPATANIELALTRRTKAAMPNITDRDVIAKIKVGHEMVTSGGVTDMLVHRLTFTEDDELLVVEDPLYFQVDSSGTTLTQTVYCRIGYERATISDVDRLTLLTQSLD